MITDYFSITELSNLTHKTRPTLYKYVSLYEEGKYNEIPYAFIKLFDLISTSGVKRSDILSYCRDNFENDQINPKLSEIISLLKKHQKDLDFDKLKEYILGEINHGGSN